MQQFSRQLKSGDDLVLQSSIAVPNLKTRAATLRSKEASLQQKFDAVARGFEELQDCLSRITDVLTGTKAP